MPEESSSPADLSYFGHLVRRISRMSPAQQKQLLEYVEEKFRSRPRKHDRKAFSATVDYVVDGRCYRDFILDMSDSGVFINTYQRFQVGQAVLMTFMAPDMQTPFKITGEVTRTQEHGIGVAFVIDSQVQAETIASLVRQIQQPEALADDP